MMNNNPDEWPNMRHLAPEDRAILRRAGLVMGWPRKAIGASGGYWWIDADLKNNRPGKMWDTFNPLREPKQAFECLCKHKIDLVFTDEGVWADGYKFFMPLGDGTMEQCVARAITTALALKCTEPLDVEPAPTPAPPPARVTSNLEALPNVRVGQCTYTCSRSVPCVGTCAILEASGPVPSPTPTPAPVAGSPKPLENDDDDNQHYCC